MGRALLLFPGGVCNAIALLCISHPLLPRPRFHPHTSCILVGATHAAGASHISRLIVSICRGPPSDNSPLRPTIQLSLAGGRCKEASGREARWGWLAVVNVVGNRDIIVTERTNFSTQISSFSGIHLVVIEHNKYLQIYIKPDTQVSICKVRIKERNRKFKLCLKTIPNYTDTKSIKMWINGTQKKV